MRMVLRLLAVGGVAAAAAGCAISPPSTDVPYPVYGNPVNPTPVAAYRVECRSVPGLGYALFQDFSTGCRQVLVPSPSRAIIRTKG